MTQQFDVIVLGSGFGGSVLGMILARSGLSVANIDRTCHPRFAIGESTTPLADQLLKKIGETYELPELLPLTSYGTWKETHPQLTCGLKRGFSYFGHHPDKLHAPHDQMLVAASRNDAVSDTHWLRSDVDAFLFAKAADRGVHQIQNASVELQQHDNYWVVSGVSGSNSYSLKAPFIVDATGNTALLLRHLRVPDCTQELQTHSTALFAHFQDVPRVQSMLPEEFEAMHPFACDAAAVHHVLDNGWMWQLRFDDDSLSAGFVGEFSTDRSASDQWQAQLQRFPFLKRQFENASVISSRCELQVTARLQRLSTKAAGRNWAALPHTAGFVDPLHSTGIAHTLSAVLRLSEMLLQSSDSMKPAGLEQYGQQTISELRFIDELVEGCYAALPDFKLWCDWCMLYFAAVTSMEQNAMGNSNSFLRANDQAFRSCVGQARELLQIACAADAPETAEAEFRDSLRDLIAPWNHVGLLNPDGNGMYTETAASI